MAWIVALVLLVALVLYVAIAGFVFLTNEAAYNRPPLSMLVQEAFPSLRSSVLGPYIAEPIYAARLHFIIFAASAYAIYVPIIWAVAFLIPTLRGHPLAYGWEWPSTSLFLNVTVKPDAKSVAADAEHKLLTFDRALVPRTWLGHTAIHNDARATTLLVEWLRQPVPA